MSTVGVIPFLIDQTKLVVNIVEQLTSTGHEPCIGCVGTLEDVFLTQEGYIGISRLGIGQGVDVLLTLAQGSKTGRRIKGRVPIHSKSNSSICRQARRYVRLPLLLLFLRAKVELPPRGLLCPRPIRLLPPQPSLRSLFLLTQSQRWAKWTSTTWASLQLGPWTNLGMERYVDDFCAALFRLKHSNLCATEVKKVPPNCGTLSRLIPSNTKNRRVWK